jgi:hypothetical protein
VFPTFRASSLSASTAISFAPISCVPCSYSPDSEPPGTAGPSPPHGHGRRTAVAARGQATSGHLRLS